MVQMTQRHQGMRWAGCVAGLGVCLILVGCPWFTPQLLVSPHALSFGSTSTRESFSIGNAGGGALQWSVAEVAWDAANQEWVGQDIPWLTIEADKTSGTTTSTTDWVVTHASREGLPAGTYDGAGFQVTSNGGTFTIPVSMTVPTTTEPGQPGEVSLTVIPKAVTIRGLTDTATFDVTNEGDALVHWFAAIRINAPNVSADAPIQIAATPNDAVIEPNKTTTVTVRVPDPTTFDNNTLNYIIAIRNRADDTLITEVQVTVDLIGPPAVEVDPAVLDFGKDQYQLSFQVYNPGDPFSTLDFGVFSQVTAATAMYVPYDIAADPLIAAIIAPQGTTGIRGDVADPTINEREVSVTISRDGIEKDLEFRDLWIGAVKGTDESGQPLFDPDIAPRKVQVRVEAAPYVEGATNRSRPPSLMRFVFLLRDKRGQAINAADDLIRSRMSFFLKEDTFPLDPNESSTFITGPENLKYNIVLLLDFTGSMYQAGVGSTASPLAPGEAIQQMVDAAKQFVLDLPASYRVALMEYHDRQQPSHVIHGFDTNKAAMLAALDTYHVPAPEHGASEILDVLYDATQALVQEDSAQTLPFDEADVRSIVFVSDGWDTSSTRKIDAVTKFAQDSRVRLYPIGFSGRLSNPVNSSVMIQLAAATGGHSYYAPEIGDLTKLLDTEKALSFRQTTVDLAAGTATLRLSNVGATSITWRATENLDWLTVFPPSGTIPPLHRTTNGTIDEPGVREVTVAMAVGLLPGTYEGPIVVNSDSGDATVSVSATVAPGGSLSAFTLMPQTGDPGRVWRELKGQVVLSYTSLFQAGKHTYSIETTFPDSQGKLTTASFEKDAVYFSGDVRAGQVSLSTTGIHDGKAEIFLRADYVPRDITQFRFRFILDAPVALTPNLSMAQRVALMDRLKAALQSKAVSVPDQGLLNGWRLINIEGNGIFSIVTDPEHYLTYGAFGDLLKLTFDGLGPDEAFTVGLRVDNTLYYSPASTTGPSLTKYFLYPGGRLNPDGLLKVAAGSDAASPAVNVGDFALPFDPEAAGAWDRDGDGWADFDDSAPDNPNAGDLDRDGVPDLNDPAPNDPTIH